MEKRLERAWAWGVAEALSPRVRSATFLPHTSRRDMDVHTRSLFLRHPLRGDEKACETLVAEPWLSSLGLDLRSSLKTSIFRRIPNLWDMSIARRCGHTSNTDEAHRPFDHVSGCGPGHPPGGGGHAACGAPRPSAASERRSTATRLRHRD